jgi:rare lipoprotein A
MPNRLCLAAVLALSTCTHQAPVATPSGPPVFTVGPAYQAGGEWRYPQSFNNYDVTGLSTVIVNPPGAFTADNEAYDPNALAAASPVLQLPAIVTVTNLVNGYSMDVRVNDRGPDVPGRVIAVTPRVATLLGLPQDGVAEVEVALKPRETAALDSALGQGPKLTAAPVAGIQAVQLGAPGSANGPAEQLTPQDSAGPDVATAPLSGQVTVYSPSAGPLYVQIPGFGRARDAKAEANQLVGIPAEIVPVTGQSRTLYAVNCGPYHSVADADAALQEVLARGVTDPEIIVR